MTRYDLFQWSSVPGTKYQVYPRLIFGLLDSFCFNIKRQKYVLNAISSPRFFIVDIKSMKSSFLFKSLLWFFEVRQDFAFHYLMMICKHRRDEAMRRFSARILTFLALITMTTFCSSSLNYRPRFLTWPSKL